jgi:hypothetical protein
VTGPFDTNRVMANPRGYATEGVTGMNLGREVPGLFDVEMQVRDLSLKVRSC